MNDSEKQCRNCNVPISADAKYCSQCSQKNTDGKVPVLDFIKDFFTNLFNVDSKLFLTFFALFIPGKLTVEYFKGKHKSYASPVRLFLYAGITLFAIVISKTQDIDFGNDFGKDRYIKIAERSRLKKVVLDNVKKFQEKYQAPSNYHQSDSLEKWLINGLGSSRNDSVRINSFFAGGEDKSFKISPSDFANLPLDSLMTKYSVEKGFRSIIISQQIKTLRDGKGVFHYFIGKLPIMIFFMMPFLALILKVLYGRHNYYFVEHLVFSFHTHTLAFLVTLLLVLLGGYFHGLLIAAFILSIFIYQFIAMRRVYQQGFFKTTFKFILLNFTYMFLVIFFFVIAVSFSFFMF